MRTMTSRKAGRGIAEMKAKGHVRPGTPNLKILTRKFYIYTFTVLSAWVFLSCSGLAGPLSAPD